MQAWFMLHTWASHAFILTRFICILHPGTYTFTKQLGTDDYNFSMILQQIRLLISFDALQ